MRSKGHEVIVRVLVIGGRGHIGAQIVAALRGIDGIEVVVAGRRVGPEVDVAVDVTDPGTFPAIVDGDCVVNCTDTYTATPDALFAHCLGRTVRFIETTAEPDAYLRLLQIARQLAPADLRGTAVLGVGAFPGISNLLAAAAARCAPGCDRLEVTVSWSVLSGAGAGTCEVMVRALSAPLRRYRNGILETVPPIGDVVRDATLDAVAYEIGLADPLLIHYSTGVPTIRFAASPRPRSPRWAVRTLSALARRGVFRPLWVQALLRGTFRGLRAGLLRRRTTAIRMVARARAPGQEPATRLLDSTDAFSLSAHTVAATIALLAERHVEPGTYTVDQLLGIDEVLARLRAHGGPPTTLS